MAQEYDEIGQRIYDENGKYIPTMLEFIAETIKEFTRVRIMYERLCAMKDDPYARKVVRQITPAFDSCQKQIEATNAHIEEHGYTFMECAMYNDRFTVRILKANMEQLDCHV